MAKVTWNSLSASMQQAIRALLRKEGNLIAMRTRDALINRGLAQWVSGGIDLTDAGQAIIPEQVKALWQSSRIAPSLARRAEDARASAIEYRETHGDPIDNIAGIFAGAPEPPEEVDTAKALKLAEFYLQRALSTDVMAAVKFDVERALDEVRKLAAEQAGGE